MHRGQMASRLCFIPFSIIVSTIVSVSLLFFLYGNRLYSRSTQTLKPHAARRENIASGCINGHVHGFVPVCGDDGCLRHLTGQISDIRMTMFTKKRLTAIRTIAGMCDVSFHAPFALDVSHMQWKHGVFGSVGEVGVFQGRYTSVLAAVTQTNAGERLFAADIFQQKTALSVELGTYKPFLQSMKLAGFTLNPTLPENKLYLFSNSSVFLSKNLFLKHDLPAFRLLSIDGGHVRPIVLNDFEKAACVLEKGGIIVFDDAFHPMQPEVRTGIKDFFDMYGATAFLPLVASHNKLFVCTADFYDNYMGYIRKHLANKYHLKEVTDLVFVRKGHRYFEGDDLDIIR